MPADPHLIVAQYERRLATRSLFDQQWDELAEFCAPHRPRVTQQTAVGAKQTERLFDSTAPEAAGLLSATMQGSLTSSAVPWFHLKMRRQELNDQKAVQDWLEECESRLYLAFRQSEFYAQSVELYFDMGVFGTAALFVDERPLRPDEDDEEDLFRGLLFRFHPVGTYVIDEAPDGTVDTFIRVSELSARSCVTLWTEAKVGDEIRTKAEQKPEELVRILHAVMPRYDRDRTKRSAQHMPWRSCYIDLARKHLIDEGGFREFPYLVPRWAKTSELYGRSPGMTALPDIRTLNQARELYLQAAELAIRPPLTEREGGVIGDIDLTPAGHTTVEEHDALKAFETGTKFDVSELLKEDLRASVRRMFFWEQLQLVEGKQMTATEVERRWDIMRRILGPTLGRLESEFLNKLIGRCFGLMYRRGALPRAPEELAGEELDIEYEGPLARSQKAVHLTAFEQAMAVLSPMLPDPEVANRLKENLDIDALIRDVFQTAGAPSKWLTSTEQRDRQREARLQAQKIQQGLAAVEQMAGAGGKAAPLLKLAGPQAGQEAAA